MSGGPSTGGTHKFQDDPHWGDYLLFYEYFKLRHPAECAQPGKSGGRKRGATHFRSVIRIAVVIAIAPTLGAATLRSAMLMPGKERTFASAGEFRVCNEDSTPVRVWIANNMTNSSTASLLQSGRCVQSIGTMISFENDTKTPVMLYAYGSLDDGRPGRAPGPGHLQ